MFYDKIPQALKYKICQHESTVKLSLSFQYCNKALQKEKQRLKKLVLLPKEKKNQEVIKC